MKQESLEQFTAADIALAKANAMLTHPYYDEAGRHAYYAMFHAAHAFVLECGFKAPKTHRGLHQLFAQATSTYAALQPLLADLGTCYRFKWIADYAPTSSSVSAAEAQAAISDATAFVAAIRAARPPASTP